MSIDAKMLVILAGNALKSLALHKYELHANVDSATSRWFAMYDKKLKQISNAHNNAKDANET